MSKFQNLLSEHIATSFLKQNQLGSFLGDHNWNLSMAEGLVDFGMRRVFPVQIIGSESEESGTWLWAWANEESSIPAGLLAAANTLRELGEREGILELTEPQLNSDEVDGHLLAMLACGVCNGDAYYRGPYEGGAVFFLIQQMPLQKAAGASAVELINIMSSVISQFPVNHRSMAQSFLQQQGYTLTEESGQILATSQMGEQIKVGFDEKGRINGMDTELTAASPSVAQTGTAEIKKPWWKRGR